MRFGRRGALTGEQNNLIALPIFPFASAARPSATLYGQSLPAVIVIEFKLEQMIVWGQGARRLSASGLWEEIEQINSEIRTTVQGNREHINNRKKRNYLLDNVSDDVSRTLDEIKTRNAD